MPRFASSEQAQLRARFIAAERAAKFAEAEELAAAEAEIADNAQGLARAEAAVGSGAAATMTLAQQVAHNKIDGEAQDAVLEAAIAAERARIDALPAPPTEAEIAAVVDARVPVLGTPLTAFRVTNLDTGLPVLLTFGDRGQIVSAVEGP